MAVTLTKRPLTVEQFNRMIDVRIFPEEAGSLSRTLLEFPPRWIGAHQRS